MIDNFFKEAKYKKNKENFLQKQSIISKIFVFLLKNKKIFFSIIFLIFLFLISILIPLIYPYDYFTELGIFKNASADNSFSLLPPFKFSLSEQKQMQSGQFIWPHIFGTDRNGRDYFIRVIYAIRISLCVGLISAFIVLIIGVIYGAIAGMKGGKTDLIMMRIVDGLYALPDLIAIIFFSAIIKEFLHINDTSVVISLLPIFVVFMLFYWIDTAVLIRSQVLLLKKRDFVTASKTMGASNFFIIKKHIIPNCTNIIIVSLTKRIPTAIFTETTLAFLGLGISKPIPSLGGLINEEINEILNYPWLALIPAIIVSLIVLAFYFIGEGLRARLNPVSN
ncbi:MAG: ABC transporter permease [Bacilli bacterium]|nr:ABC transporter permease [Bacilli bacterium]